MRVYPLMSLIGVKAILTRQALMKNARFIHRLFFRLIMMLIGNARKIIVGKV